MNPTTAVFNIVLVVFFILIALWFKTNDPKEINPIINYRTKRSMSSRDNWLFANKFASKMMFKLSFALIPLSLLLYVFYDTEVALFGMIGLWVVILIFTIIETERRLKQQEGHKKEK